MEHIQGSTGGHVTRDEVAKRTVDRVKKFTEALESGERISDLYTVRKYIFDVELEPYQAHQVRDIRQSLRMSQGLFAKFLNVSPSAVRKWEQGIQQPDGAACRLLDEMRQDPEYWRKRFRSMARLVNGGVPK